MSDEIEARVLVVCGTSIATSTVVVKALEEQLPEYGIKVKKADKCKAAEAPGKASPDNFDIMITTTQVNEKKIDIPVVQTLAFMTGQGKEEALEEISEKIKKSVG